MKFNTLSRLVLALIASKNSLAFARMPVDDYQNLEIDPINYYGADQIVFSPSNMARNSTTDGVSLRDMLEEYTRRQSSQQCKSRFSPDTILTIIFGAGGLLEPVIIAVFFRRVAIVNVQGIHRSADLEEDLRGQGIVMQDLTVSEVPFQDSIGAVDSTRPDAQRDGDKYPSSITTAPPYSLTDVTLAY